MNLTQLTVFREVMLSGSVSQAARNLGRTQPAISATLAALEEQLGLRLFERKGRRLYPVPEAHYLLAESSEILDRLTSTRRNLQNLKTLRGGELRVAAMPGPSVFLLPRLVSRLTRGRDDIRVTLVTRSSPQVHQLVATQSYDLGIADTDGESGGGSLVTVEPATSNCLCAIPGDDPLARRRVLRPSDLDGRPFAALNADHQTHRATRAAFEAAGARLNVRYETQYFLPLLTFVEDGLAFAIVDTLSAESYCSYRGAGARGIVFRAFEPRIPLCFATLTPAHRAQSLMAQAFVDAWRQEVGRINRKWEAAAGARKSPTGAADRCDGSERHEVSRD